MWLACSVSDGHPNIVSFKWSRRPLNSCKYKAHQNKRARCCLLPNLKSSWNSQLQKMKWCFEKLAGNGSKSAPHGRLNGVKRKIFSCDNFSHRKKSHCAKKMEEVTLSFISIQKVGNKEILKEEGTVEKFCTKSHNAEKKVKMGTLVI